MKNIEQLLQPVLDQAIDGKQVFGTAFCVEYQGEHWCGASGDLCPDQPHFIASTTKLYVTALILYYRAQGKLDLEDKLRAYLDEQFLQGLNVWGGYDHSAQITIRQLLSHTSGVPDYFQQKDEKGQSLESRLIKGQYQRWSFEEVLARSKKLRPLFPPGAPGKAHYSDTNFQLLGRIIEELSGKSFAAACRELIITPLGLKQTYLYTDPSDMRPKTIYYKATPLQIPQAMASFGPDGGMVSVSSEMLVFLKAFFSGHFFPKAYLHEMQVWNRVFFPMRSGVGIHQFKLPRFFDPMGRIPAFIGHSGLSGAVAYYSPERDLYFCGTVNQIAYPDRSFRLMVDMTRKLLTKLR